MKNKTYSKFILIFLIIITLGFKPSNTIPYNDKFVVVLDAGHGGKDSGNIGNGYREKDIALKVVLDVGKKLEKDGRFKVIYTRKKDEFIELHERGNIANKANADLFVSIHCNAHRSKAQGTETFVLGLHANKDNFNVAKQENSVILLEEDYKSNYDGFDPNSPESVIGLTILQEEYLEQSLTLASIVQNSFTKSLKRRNRGVKQAGFVVLHQTFMPSVLIELGFLTNSREGRYLNSKKGQTEMSNSIFKSILNYKKSVDALYQNNTTVTKKQIHKDITFKVQISASSRAIEPKPYNFNGLDQVSRFKIGDVYKYFFGSTSDYIKIKEQKKQAEQEGFESSFIVAFKDGKMIPLSEALDTESVSN